MQNPLPELTRRNLSEEVYDVLRRGILTRYFAPGERLKLDDIEEQLGVSRTPLKVALDRLSAEGLVVVMPRRGTFVSDDTPDDTAEAFDVRCVLEAYAAELAAETASDAGLKKLRAKYAALDAKVAEGESGGECFLECLDLDRGFHETLIALAGNSRLTEAWEGVSVHVHMARVRNRDAERVFTVSLREHEEILKAIEAHDPAAARAAMDAHLGRAKANLLEDMARDL
jgi:DNA-binding GntR family transcriptional regulator